MNGVREYIKTIVPNPIYSEMFSKEFLDDGSGVGTFTVDIDYRDRGAKCILVHWIIINTRDTDGGLFQITDNFGRLLMKFISRESMNGIYAFNHVIGSSKIFLKYETDNNTQTFATAHYQYIYDTESKVLKL